MAKIEKTGKLADPEYWVQVDKDGNPITGEVKPVDVIVKPTERNGFYITYLATICAMIEKIGNKKMQVVKYILKNMDSNNKLTETTAEIAKGSGVSEPVVLETLKILKEADIVSRKTGLVMLNPKLLHKGNAQKERYLMTKFREVGTKQNSTSTSNANEKPETPSNAPESPTTHETPQARENVPAEGEKREFGANTAKFDVENLKIQVVGMDVLAEQLPELIGSPEKVRMASQIRDGVLKWLYQEMAEFSKAHNPENLEENHKIAKFLTILRRCTQETSADFWFQPEMSAEELRKTLLE